MKTHLHAYFYSMNQFTRLVIFIFLTLFLGCQHKNQDAIEVKFIFGPDDSGTLETLIDQFNKENKGVINVNYIEGSRSSDIFYEELEKEFKSNQGKFDAFAGDVIWTSAFAQNKWVEDLTDKFFSNYQPEQFVKPAMQSASYQYRIWGIPWFTDTGILFYRKDLLDQIGVQPPKTWEELRTISKRLKADNLIEDGFVFQGAAYEGGVANMCEFIWNAGGNVLLGDLATSSEFDEITDPEVISINSKESLTGVYEITKIMDEEIAPKGIFQYRELDAGLAFRDGKAVFMRGWPSSYGLLLDRKSEVKPSQVGIANIPTSSLANKSFSCLGGWNLMVNANSSEDKKEATWTFINFLMKEESQRYRAENGGMLPSLRSLYRDSTLLKSSPVVAFAKEVIANTHERPKTPYYMEISPEIATIFNQVLIGVITPEGAVQTLDRKLKEILLSHQSDTGG